MIDRWWSISGLKPLFIICLVTCNIKTSFHRPLYCYYLTYINHTLLKEKTKKKNKKNTEHWRDEQHGSITTKAFHIVVILLMTITTSFHMPIFVINDGESLLIRYKTTSLLTWFKTSFKNRINMFCLFVFQMTTVLWNLIE